MRYIWAVLLAFILALWLAGCGTLDTRGKCVQHAERAYNKYVSRDIPCRIMYGVWTGEGHAWVEYYHAPSGEYRVDDKAVGNTAWPREAYKTDGVEDYRRARINQEYKGEA